MEENTCETPKLVKTLSVSKEIDDIFQLIYEEKKEELIEYILDDNNEIWKIKRGDDITLLHSACVLDKTDIIEIIINETKKRLHLNLKGSLSSEEESKNEKIFKDFINARTQADGLTALHYASFRGNIKIIKLLIINYADIDALTNNGLNMIHKSAQGNKPSAIIYFNKKYHMSLEETEKNKKLNALHLATISGMEESVIFLLYLGVNPNKIDIRGYTALHYAVKYNNIRIIKKLLQNGANKDIKNLNNKTPFMMAQKKPEIMEIFRKKNICEKLFFKPDITKKNFNSNIIIFFTLHILIFLLVFFTILPCFNNTIFSIAYIVIYFFVFVLYILLFFSNPGIMINKEYEDLLDIVEKGGEVEDFCPHCLVKHKYKSLHCLICEKCIEEFDHHCFWVGNCIGNNNYTLFFIFLIYVLLNIFFNFGIPITYLLIIILNKDENRNNAFPGFLFELDSILYNKIVRIISSSIIIITCISFFIPLFNLFKMQLLNALERRQNRIDEEEFEKNRLTEKLDEAEENDKTKLKEKLDEDVWKDIRYHKN